MNDLQTLTDAFTELERRADLAVPRKSAAAMPRTSSYGSGGRPRWRLMPVLATAAAVVAVATVPALLVSGGSSPTGGGAPQAPTSVVASSAAGSADPSTAASGVPVTGDELVARFTAILAGSGTFTVRESGSQMGIAAPSETDPPGASATAGGADPSATGDPNAVVTGSYLVGTLTIGGVSGGFDLQILGPAWDAAARCSDDDHLTGCQLSTLPDGSTLATASDALQVPGGVTHAVVLLRPDGFELVMHVSNAADPKGAGAVSGETPPMTIDQMVAILTSPLWA